MFIKPLSVILEKWRARAQAATEAYRDGVSDPKVRWEEPTMDAAAAWADGVARAAALGLFAKGVDACGDGGWQAKAIKLGVPRYGPGIRDSGDAYSKGFAPYHSALAGLILPPRYARRDERNRARFNAVVDEMIRVKEGLIA